MRLTLLLSVFAAWMIANGALASQYSRRFQLDSAITATKLSSTTRSNLEEVLRSYGADLSQVRSTCAFRDLKNLKCAVFDWGIVYAPPYPIALDTAGISAGADRTFIREWVAAGDVRDGLQQQNAWRTLAESGTPFSCANNRCVVVVEVFMEGQRAEEKSLARCNVTRAGGSWGPPEACEQLAIWSDRGNWLFAVTGSKQVRSSVGRPDFVMYLRGTAPRYQLPTKRVVASALQRELGGNELRLEVEAGEDWLQAVGAYRASPVLNGWREDLTIRLELREESRGQPSIGITVLTTLYVNRQNTSRPMDWHRPDQQQETQYLSRIRRAIDSAVRQVCKIVIRIDTNEVSCLS